MKKTTFFTLLLSLSTSFFLFRAEAKIWRVNNQSNFDNTDNFGENYGGTSAYPVFKEINEAVANANVQDGDTLYIEASPTAYRGATISKRLVIIGAGFFVTENSNTSNTVNGSDIGFVSFNQGSEFSQLIGINTGSYYTSTDTSIYISTNDITIKRCRITGGVGFGTSNLLRVSIIQNIFALGGDATLFNNCCSAFVAPQEIVFNNNIVLKKLIWTGRNILECKNNVFDGPPNELNLYFNTDSFQNNILRAAGITANINEGTNANVEFNTVSNSALFEGTPGIVVVPAMNNLFVQDSSTDGNYQLQAGATGNVPGKDGAERGAFGGATVAQRYSLSGLATIPVIYSVSTTGVSEQDNGLPVKVEARIIK